MNSDDDVTQKIISDNITDESAVQPDSSNPSLYASPTQVAAAQNKGDSSKSFKERVLDAANSTTGSSLTRPNPGEALSQVTTNRNPNVRYKVDKELIDWKNYVSLVAGKGLVDHKLTNYLMEFNHRIVDSPVPIHQETTSLAFFVRPDCNLDERNIANSRKLSSMISNDISSIDYAILAALDPNCPYTNKGRVLGNACQRGVPFNNTHAFIPALTDLLVTLDGFPNSSLETWSSDEGIAREQWGLADSIANVYYGYTLSSSFYNMIGEFIPKLIDIWVEYISGLKQGRFKPKMQNSIQRRIDYTSRVYLISTTATGKIYRFTNCGWCWPTANNLGDMSRYDRTRANYAEQPQANFQWQCYGAQYNDPLAMHQFNVTQQMFNPSMIPLPNTEGYVPKGHDVMRKLTHEEAQIFNWRGYPYINIEKMQLEWYIYQVDYEEIAARLGV